ncbi:MAG: hypothetical protein GDA35_00580 [Hyphomonadaceae bacterium]|nr:hypothetical protein [Hyphomonadaceae bacterium]
MLHNACVTAIGLIRHVVLGSVLLASTVDLAPAAFGQDVDTEPPVVSFSPNNIEVKSGATVPVALTATDDVGVAKLRVKCHPEEGGSFSVEDNTYTAPDVDQETFTWCLVEAYDAAGNKGQGLLAVGVLAAPPAAVFDTPRHGRMEVEPGETITVKLTVADRFDIADIKVTCDHGSYNVGHNTYAAPEVDADTTDECRAGSSSGVFGNFRNARFNVGIDATPPVVAFIPDTLTLNWGETAEFRTEIWDREGSGWVTCSGGWSRYIGSAHLSTPVALVGITISTLRPTSVLIPLLSVRCWLGIVKAGRPQAHSRFTSPV